MKMTFKSCTKCGESKPLDQFGKDRSRKDGLSYICKDCTRSKVRKSYGRHKDRIAYERAERKSSDPSHAEQVKQYRRQWYLDNKQSVIDQNRENKKTRRANDPDFIAAESSRRLLTRCLDAAGIKKQYRTTEMLGYSSTDLKDHIESQFADGMTWENRQLWHIDHIKPVIQFIREGVTDPSVINALTNLQPLWADQNLSKGASYG